MDKLFGDLAFVAVYVDDIVIFSESLGSHVHHVLEFI